MATLKKLQPNRFERFISQTIAFETGGNKAGAYTNDPKDPGGETKWGISKSAHPTVNIKALTYKDAKEIYFTQYYNPLYDLMQDEAIAFKLFDMSVLMGTNIAVKLLQQSVLDMGITLKVDGKFGPMTLAGIQLAISKNPTFFYDFYIRRLIDRISWNIILHPTTLKFRKGWINRININITKGVSDGGSN